MKGALLLRVVHRRAQAGQLANSGLLVLQPYLVLANSLAIQ